MPPKTKQVVQREGEEEAGAQRGVEKAPPESLAGLEQLIRSMAVRQEERMDNLQHQLEHLKQRQEVPRDRERTDAEQRNTEPPRASRERRRESPQESFLPDNWDESSPRYQGRGTGMTKEPKMHPFKEDEDIEHYLTTFERIALACRWPREDWGLQLVPLLTGKARAAYVAMDIEYAMEYDSVKEAILAKYEINTETY